MRKPASTSVSAAITFALLSALCTAPAFADGGSSRSQSTARLDDAWHYGTYYIFPLTRHIDESEVSKPWRYGLYPITAILDTVQLPFGAIAGLFGD